MRKIALFTVAIIFALFASGQTVVFHENFELPSGGDSLITTAVEAGIPTTNFNPWSLSGNLAKSGAKSDSNRVQNGKTIFLTSNSFSTIGNTYIILQFSHICKLFITDGGQVEVSINGGLNWITLGSAQYLGDGVMALEKFSENSYGNEWKPSDTITKPNNSWWRTEKFDISTLAANQANVKIRFKYSGSGNPSGAGRYGWLLDDVNVTMNPTELVPPVITMITYPTDTAYYGGPYPVSAYVKDASGVDTVYLSYKIGDGIFTQLGMQKSLLIDSLYTAEIPYAGYGRRIFYTIVAKDASLANNIVTNPISGYYSFFTKYSAGGNVIVGTATTNQNYPFKSNADNTKSASLYLYSTINKFGLINQLKWNVSTAQPAVNIPIKIYIKQTSSSVMNAETWDNLKTNAVLVYDGVQVFSSTGWNTINLTTSFNYNSGNLMVLCEANYGGTGAVSSPSFYYSTVSNGLHQFFSSFVTTTGVLNTQRPNITIGFISVPLPALDAGISQIISPSGVVVAGTSFNLIAKLKNFGNLTLTKANIVYSIDGNLPVISGWTGNLLKDSAYVFNAGSLNLAAGFHILKVWTSLPNDSIDLNFLNDTAYYSFYACAGPMNGNYTIGGIGADFPSFSDAYIGLTQCGINAAVVFNVAPGIYSDQLTMSPIAGASAINTITFKSTVNDSNSVIMSRVSTSASNWIVKLNGADFITFKNIKFAPSDSLYSVAVILTNGATNNSFIGNIFQGYSGTALSQSLLNIEGSTVSNSNNLIQGNFFSKGCNAISIKGLALVKLKKTIIKNNLILNSSVYGIYAQYIDSTLIDSNTVNSSALSIGNKYGIYLQYGNILNTISKNTINLSSGNGMYGILIENSISNDTTKGLIANNFISVLNGNGITLGVRLNSVTKFRLFSNSIITTGNNITETRGVDVASSCLGISLKNNNIYSNKYVVYFNGLSVESSDYNNYFSTGNNIAFWNTNYYSDLTSLKAASLMDSNSISVNPFFIASSDLHTYNGLLKGKGIYLSDIITDIDGETRLNPPCIGADEFIPPLFDAALINVLKPNGSCGLSTTEDIKIVIKSVGNNAITPNTITARYKLDNNVVVSELINRSINSNDTIHFVFNTKANLAGSASLNDTSYTLRVWTDLSTDYAHANDSSSQLTVNSLFVPIAPVVTNVNSIYGASVTLNAISNKPVFWYDSISSSTPMYIGNSYITPNLPATDTFYVESNTNSVNNQVIGSGLSNQAYPFYSGWGYTTSASVYLDSEIGGYGEINQLGWDVITPSLTNIPIRIYLKEIPLTSLVPETWANLINGSTLVYDGNQTFNIPGWKSIDLTTAFHYSTGNLLVLCEANFGGSGSISPYFAYTLASAGSHHTTNANNAPASGIGATSYSRPDLKIKIKHQGCASSRVPIIANVTVPAYNTGISNIVTPSGCALYQVPVKVKIYNHGYNPLNSNTTTLTYKLDNGSFIAPENLNITILPFDTLEYTFNTLADFSAPISDRFIKVTAKVSTIGDLYPINDSLAKDSILSGNTPPIPSASNVNIINGSNVTLTTLNTNGNINWFDQLIGGNKIGQGSPFTTPFLIYATDTFYVEANNNYPVSKIIGTGTLINNYQTHPTPYANYSSGSKEQYLILASEMQAMGLEAGELSSVAFDVVTPSLATAYGVPATGSHMRNFNISVGFTSVSSLTAFITGLTPVYFTPHYIDFTGWNDHNFTTPVYWDGISNVLIQTCFDNYIVGSDWSDGSAIVNQTATPYISTLSYHSNYGGVCTTGGNPLSYSKRPNIKITSIKVGCTSSPRKAVIVTVSPPPQNDAGITALINPSGSIPSGVSVPIRVKIKNFGQANLINATIAWNLNNIVKPVYHFTGNLTSGQDTVITIANEIFSGGLYCIKAWTKNPNSVAVDSIASNDTLASTCFTACMNGTYTIGDTIGGIYHDFQSFNAAVNALKIGGVCGNVTFLVDIGTYNEQVRIPEITGVSANNTITFRSVSNDSTKVKLQYSPNSSNNNYILLLDSADYIRIENITLKTLSANYGNIIVLSNGACNNVISNNSIEMLVADGMSSFTGISDNSFPNFYNKYHNNYILNGDRGIYTTGSNISNLKKGTEIVGNNIMNFYSYGIYSWYQDSVKIIGNEVSTNSSNNYIYGLNIAYNNNASQILKNKIIITTTKSQYGLYLYNCIGTPTSRGLIANNMIALTGGISTSTNYGIYSAYSTYQNFYYNSLNTVSPSLNNSHALYVAGGGSDLKFLNNNFVNTGGGFAYYIQNPAAVISSDYNNIYTTGGVLGYWNGPAGNLAALQSVSANDLNSISIIPLFTSSTNLHLLSTSLSTLGIPVSGISEDIDGAIRDAVHPTIGADEVTLLQHDAGVTIISQPSSVEIESTSITVKVVVKNFGTSPITTMTVSYILNNNLPVDFIYNGSIPFNGVDTVIFPLNMSILAGNNSICAYTTLSGDSYTFNNQSCKSFFGTPLHDAQLATISSIQGGCGLSNDTVKVLIVNQGILPINGGLTANYKITGSSFSITEVVNTTIPVGGSLYYSFLSPVNLTVANKDSVFIIKAWVSLNNDNIHGNDTNYTTVKSLHTPLNPVISSISIPYATSETLSATSPSNDSLKWFDSAVLGTLLYSGNSFITPILFVTDTFYVEATTAATYNANVGNGTTIQAYPFSTNWGYTRSASIYNASEMGGFGIINKLQWFISNASSLNIPIKIYLAQTPLSTMPADTWTHLINGASLVYNDYNQFNIIGWDTINLSSSFDYTSGNLMVLCETNVGGNGSSPTSLFAFTPSALGSHQYFTSDNIPSSGNGYLSYNRPNIKIIGNIAGCSSQRIAAIVTVGNQPAIDAGVSSILKPNTGINLTNHDTVKVIIRNYGSTAISNIPVKYRLGTNNVVSEVITTGIVAGGSLEYTFNQTVDLSSNTQPHMFTITVWTDLAGDPTKLNDTLKKIIINNPFVYCTSYAINNGDEDLGQVVFAGINHGNALPVLNNSTANQSYNDYTALTPAIVQPGITYPISLSIIFSNASYSGKVCAYIDYNHNGNWDLPQELAFSGFYYGNGNSTLTGNINIPFNAISGLSRMRIVVDNDNNALPCGSYSYGETEDYSVNIIPPISHDGGISMMNGMDLLIPYYSSNSQTPQFFMRNYGSDTLTTATLNYLVNDNPLITQNWSGTLPTLAMDSVFQNISLNNGMNFIKAYTSGIAGDNNYNNDTLNLNVFKEYIAVVPYTDNFELNKYWYASDVNNGVPVNNIWEQGIPNSAFSSLNMAHSPVKVWATKLNGNYYSNNLSYLYTPVFDVSVMQPDTLKFWQWRQFGTGINGAYGQLEYKNANGVWLPLGIQNDTNASNWYNDVSNKWVGADTVWKQSKFNIKSLTNIGNTIQFRFLFASGSSSITKKGWSIDDFELTLAPIPADAGVIAINSPISNSLVGDTVTVTITVKNFGTATLNNIPVNYQVANGTVVTAVISGAVLPGATTIYSFVQTFKVGIQDYAIRAYTSVTGDFYTQNDTASKIIIVSPASYDVGITEILEPGTYVNSGQVYFPKVVIKNFGTTPMTSIPLSYQRGTQVPVTGIWTRIVALSHGDTAHYTFPTSITTPSGISFGLSAFTTLANDAYLLNNKFNKTIFICNVPAPIAIIGSANPVPGQIGVPYAVDSVPNATFYTWSYTGSGVTINGNGNRMVTLDFANNATYGQLSVTASNANCTSIPTVLILVGINEINESNFWLGQNMPNPAIGITSIAYHVPSSSEISFEIVNPFGQIIYSKKEKAEAGIHLFEIDIKGFSSGVYYYSAIFKGKRITKKMLINK